MATTLKLLMNGYHYVVEDLADPRTNTFFLIGSPWPILMLVFAYIYFVFNFGPTFMQHRKPYRLKKILALYNVIQVLCNAVIFFRALQYGWFRDFNWSCQPVDFSINARTVEMTKSVWYFFLLKILDLLDTVFFILRKKQSHVSFLHVYHHAGMVIAAWVATKYLPDGNTTFLGLVNAFVHMVMYAYYLMSTYYRSPPSWKRHVTHLQLTQFVLIMLHSAQVPFVKNCNYPTWPSLFLVPQNVFMIVLFLDFYYKQYIRQPKRTTERDETREDLKIE